MASQAVLDIARPGSALAEMGVIGQDTATTIGNAIRGAMNDSQVDVAELMGFIANIPSDQTVEDALGADSRFSHLVGLGAASAAENLKPIDEKLIGIPDQDDVISAISDPNNTDSLPYLFGLGGTEAGDELISNAIVKIESGIRNYTPTEIKIPYRYVAQNSLPAGAGINENNGGLILNRGGMIPFARGGVARYQNGGRLAFPGGSIVPGFGNYDNVPALLTPGEFVIRREAVEKYGRNFFAGLNSTIYNTKPDLSAPSYSVSTPTYKDTTKDADGGKVMYNNSYQINVNVKSESDPDQIARTVVDQIKRVDSQRIRGNRF
jgi:hypothetical protein